MSKCPEGVTPLVYLHQANHYGLVRIDEDRAHMMTSGSWMGLLEKGD